MSKSTLFATLLLAVALAAGCSKQKPAGQAIAAAEQSLADVSELSLKYVPKEYGEVKAELDVARKLMQEEKYAEALTTAEAIPPKAKAVGEEAAAARDKLLAELQAEWGPLAESLPGELEALEKRVAELSALKRLPKGIEPRELRSASEGLTVAQKAWTEAQAEFGQGNLEGAVARAHAVKLLTTNGLAALDPSKPTAG